MIPCWASKSGSHGSMKDEIQKDTPTSKGKGMSFGRRQGPDWSSATETITSLTRSIEPGA